MLRVLIENQFDNKVRAETLIKFINSKKKITIKKKTYSNFQNYYIAHPIIRNLVLNPKKFLKSGVC